MIHLIDNRTQCSNMLVEHLMSTLDPLVLATSAPELACNELNADVVAFAHMSETSRLILAANARSLQSFHMAPQTEVLLKIAQSALGADKPLLSSAAKPGFDAALAAAGFHTLLCIPVQAQDQLVGIVIVLWEDVMPPDPELIGQAALFGRYLGMAFANAQRYVDAERGQGRSLQRLLLAERLDGMSRLTAVIAHEINNPLQAIVNTLQLLGRPLEPEKRELYLSMAQVEAERLVNIVQRALAIHQPNREGRRAVGIHALIERAVDQVLPQCRERQVAIKREYVAGVPHIIGVASHLREVFLGLLQNAIEATTGGGQVTIRTQIDYEVAGAHDQVITVEVIDSGAGIPEERLQDIFEPFYTTKQEHVGMGLTICYSVIEHHAGRLSVSSSDQGTTFRISLPVASAADSV